MSNLIRAELLRIRTTRLALWLLLGTAGSVILGLALSITAAGDNGMAPLNSSEGVRNVMASAASGTILLVFLGVLLFTSEFRHNTASSTFLVSPDRSRVVRAKLLASALTGIAYATTAAVVTIAVALPWLATKHVDVSLLSSDVLVVVGTAFLATMLAGPLGVGVGALVRHQTAAIIGVSVWTMVVENVLVNAVPAVGKWFPGGALSAMTHTSTSNGDLLPMWAAAVLFAGYAAAFALIAVRFTIRRDVA
jgi:hypothetical protein